MNLIQTQTTFKSGPKTGMPRDICKVIARTYTKPEIDFETGQARIRLLGGLATDLFSLYLSAQEMADLIGAIPMGMVFDLPEPKQKEVMKALKCLTELFESKIPKPTPMLKPDEVSKK